MARARLYVHDPDHLAAGSIMWGSVSLQAAELANAKRPARNPLAADPDWNSLITDYFSRTDAVVQILTGAKVLMQTGLGTDIPAEFDDTNSAATPSGVVIAARFRNPTADTWIDAVPSQPGFFLNAPSTTGLAVAFALYQTNLNALSNLWGVDIGNTLGNGAKVLYYGDDGTIGGTATGPSLFLTDLLRNTAPPAPASLGIANNVGTGKNVPWSDHVHDGRHPILDGSKHTDTLLGTVVRGDIILGNATPKWARKALGTVGQYLRSDRTDLQYAVIPLGDVPAHNLLSATHGDSTAGTVARGDLITGQTASPKYQRLAVGTAGQYLKSDGTDVLWKTFEQAEASSTPVAGATSTTLGAGIRVYSFFTLPTTEAFYIITGIEWKNGATVNGNTTGGVDIVDANPPVLTPTILASLGAQVANAGANGVQRQSRVVGSPIRGGTICGVWVYTDSATETYGTTVVASANNRKTIAYTAAAPNADVTAWTASTVQAYVKAYYRGYGG